MIDVISSVPLKRCQTSSGLKTAPWICASGWIEESLPVKSTVSRNKHCSSNILGHSNNERSRLHSIGCKESKVAVQPQHWERFDAAENMPIPQHKRS